jgi:hypothetical protein
VKLPITKLLVLKKKGQNTTKKSQSCVKIVKLPITKLLVFFFTRQGLSGPYQILIISIFFARQGLSGPYQMSSKIESDMDLIILVEWKKILIIFLSVISQFSHSFVLKCCVLTFFFNTNNFVIGNFTILTQLCDFFVVFWPFFLMKGLVTSR